MSSSAAAALSSVPFAGAASAAAAGAGAAAGAEAAKITTAYNLFPPLEKLGKVTSASFSPALPSARRLGSIGGSSVKLVLSGVFDAAAVSIFQFDDATKWNEKMAFHTKRGQQYEAGVALACADSVKRSAGIRWELSYAAPTAHREMPFAFVCPDCVVSEAGVVDRYAQVKFMSSESINRPELAKSYWTFHRRSCAGRYTLNCQCLAPNEYRDQLLWEMFVTGRDNYLFAGSRNHDTNGAWVFKTEVLPLRTHGVMEWYRSVARPQIVNFYDRYLRWYWEGARDEKATREISRVVTEYNDDTEWAAVEALDSKATEAERTQLLAKSKRPFITLESLLSMKPQNVNDVLLCMHWTKMRERVSKQADSARRILREVASFAGLRAHEDATEAAALAFGKCWIATVVKSPENANITGKSCGKRRRTPL